MWKGGGLSLYSVYARESSTIYIELARYKTSHKLAFCVSERPDVLCRDEQGQISRDPRTKRLLTRRESLAKPSKHTSNSTFAHL